MPEETTCTEKLNPVSLFLATWTQKTLNYEALYSALVKLEIYISEKLFGEASEIHLPYEESEHVMDILATEALISKQLFKDNSSFLSHVIQHKLLEVLKKFCRYPDFRLKFAQKWLQAALNFLRSTVQPDERQVPEQEKPISVVSASAPYFLARECCMILTNIVESTETHSYFVDISPLAWCVRYSSDIYLSLRCCEVIFRVTRIHPSTLRSAYEFLSEGAVDAIDRLLSTRKLPVDICEVIQQIRSENGLMTTQNAHVRNNAALCVINTSEVVIFPILKRQDVAIDEKVCYRHESPDGGLMQAFFGKHMVVLDWANNPALSIPYKFIKTMKLNRHKQLVIRLKDIPFTLRDIYKNLHQSLEKNKGFPADAAVPLFSRSGFPLPFISVSHSTNDMQILPEIIISTTHEEYRKMRDAKIQSWITSDLLERKGPQVGGSQKLSEKTSSHTSNDLTLVDQNPELASIPHPGKDIDSVSFKRDTGRGYKLDALLTEKEQLGTNGFSDATREAVKDNSPIAYTNEIDPLLQELRQMITDTASENHQEGQRILDDASNQIQHEIEQFQNRSEDRYRKYQDSVCRHIEYLSTAHRNLQKHMTSLIEKLNIDVRSMAEQNLILREQLEAARNQGKLILHEMKKGNEDRISVMEQRISDRMSTISEKIHAAISSTNPLRFMTQFLAESKRPFN